MENKSNVKIRKTLRQTELKIQIIPTYLVKTLSRNQVRYFRLLRYVIIPYYIITLCNVYFKRAVKAGLQTTDIVTL